MDRHEASIVIAQPQGARQLVLLFHGVGASAEDLRALGEVLAQQRPSAAVVSVQAPHPSQLGRGWEWFSVVGMTDQIRPARVAAAMPWFLEAIAHWQKHFGMGPAQTVLLGFSQGSIMSLESTQNTTPPSHPAPAAHTVIAVAGRFAQPVRQAPLDVQFHLIHGEADGVVPTACAVEAHRQLSALHAQVTLDLVPQLGHGIDGRVLQHVLDHLPQD